MRKPASPIFYLLLSLAISVVAPSVLIAQSGSGSVSGTVRDQSGAIVPNAQVVVINDATGVARKTRTTETGLYVVPNLVPGDYSVETTVSGFKRARVSALKLAVDQHAQVDLNLEVGSNAQQVTVSGESVALLQTSDVSIGGVITSQQVQDLPLNGRYFTQLLALEPGALPSLNSASYGSTNPYQAGMERNGTPVYDINGQSGAYTAFRIDGTENEEATFGGANIPISVDAIQEFKLQTANFSSEFGRSPAQVDVVTKGGTNVTHGTLFEFVRNDATAASQWSYSGPHPKRVIKRNQFGGNMGGAIRKDKLFYFFNYEGTRQAYSVPETLTVPSAQMRQGVFPSGEIIYDPTTQQPFSNNTIPMNRLDATAQKVLPYVPAPNQPGIPETNAAGFALPPQSNYNYNPGDWDTINQYTGRIDYNLSSTNSIFFRYTYGSNHIKADGPLAAGSGGSIFSFQNENLGGQNLSGNWIHTFAANKINELRIGYSTDPQNYEKGDQTNYAARFGLTPYLYPTTVTGFPTFHIGSVTLGSGDYRPLQYGDNRIQVVDNFNYVRRSHNIRVGTDDRRAILDTMVDNFSNGRYTFSGAQTRDARFPTKGTTYCPGGTVPTACVAGDGMADFLLGYLASFSRGTTVEPYTAYNSSWAGYVNDTWHVRRNVTLILGLRYEYMTRPHSDPPLYSAPYLVNGEWAGQMGVAETSDGSLSSRVQAPYLAAPFTGMIVGCPKIGLPAETCAISDKIGWQPRIGVAWQLNTKTVVRLGAGIFYGTYYGQHLVDQYQFFPYSLSSSSPSYTKPPATPSLPPLLLSSPLGANQTISQPFVYGVNPYSKLPSTYQWNLTVDRQLRNSTSFWVGTVGSLSRHQEGLAFGNCCYYDIPQPIGVVLAPGQSQTVVDPRIAFVDMEEFQDSSNYLALQARLEHRASHGLFLTMSYSYANTLGLDTSQIADPRNREASYGPVGEFDIRHSFVFSPIWELPFGKGQRWVNGGGWENQLVGGWEFSTIITARSGYPFTPHLSGTDLLNQNGYGGSDFPDRVCNGGLSNPTVFNWFNQNCFALPTEPTTPGAQLVEGNSGAGVLFGPGSFGMDLGMQKSFPITERFRLDFRFEGFNILNHPVFGLPSSGIVPGNNTPANITYTVSIPRTLQFALKLHF